AKKSTTPQSYTLSLHDALPICGLKAFYKYLTLEEEITKDPSALIETPKIRRKLPEVLTINEMNTLLQGLDLSKPENIRNKAMLEDRKSTRLNSSHVKISYAVFC